MSSQGSVKQRSEAIATRANRISCVGILVVLIGVVWTIYHDIQGDRKLSQRLAGIETSVSSLKSSIRVLTAATAPQMQKAIDDSLTDKPAESSSLQVKERLSQVALTVKTLGENRVAESAQESQHRAAALSEILNRYPTADLAWSTAGALINYASASRVAFETEVYPECFSEGMETYLKHPPINNSRRNRVRVSHCTLYLDQQSLFDRSEYGAVYRSEVQAGVTDELVLELTNVHLVYRGGPLLNFAALYCEGCTFDVDLPSAPNVNGQTLTRALLAATDGNISDEKRGT